MKDQFNLDKQIAERRRLAKLKTEDQPVSETGLDQAVSDENALIIPLDLIEVREQARKTFDGLEDLAKTIKERGQLHPFW